MTIGVAHHGTTDGGPGVRGHRTRPLSECGEVLGHPGLYPLVKGMRGQRHLLRKRGQGLIVCDVRPGHQQHMQRHILKGRMQVAGEAIERVPRRQVPNPSSGRIEKGITPQECIRGFPPITHRQLPYLPMSPRGVSILPNLDHVLQEQLGLCTAHDDAALTGAKTRLSSPGTTPVIKAPSATHSWRAPPLGGMAELALGSSPAGGTGLGRDPREGPARAPLVAKGTCNPCGA